MENKEYELITDMNSIIDQAKFIGDIEQYWTNVRECVNFENSDIGKELSIVSEQTKTRLSQAMNNIKLDDKEQPTSCSCSNLVASL